MIPIEFSSTRYSAKSEVFLSYNTCNSVPIPQAEGVNIFPPIHIASLPQKDVSAHTGPQLLLLAPHLQMGGADKFNLDLLRGLSQRGYSVAVATTLPNENPWKDLFLAVTPEVYCLPDFLDHCEFPAFLHEYIHSRGVDVLLVSNTTYGYYMVPWLRSRFPSLTVIDYVHSVEKAWRSGGFARLSGYLSEFLDRTYTCNNATREQLVAEYNHAPERVDTIYVGVDADHFASARSPDLSVHELLGFEQNRPIVLFPCRVTPVKRSFLMLEIAKRMRERGSAPAFVVVGDGPDMDEVCAFIEAQGLGDTVYLAGARRELRPFYRDAALTLVCSLYEGLSLTAYESMAMETPVITSDVGGQAELVSADTGAVIPLLADEEKDLYARAFAEEEIELYAEAIGRLLADTPVRLEMGRKARQRVLQGFTIQNMVERFDSEIQALLRQRKTQGGFKPASQPVLLYEELAILAGEFERRETLVQRQEQQLYALRNQPSPPPPPSPLWRLLAPVTSAVNRVPGLRMLLTRNRKAK